jgi:DNA ligase D-like protein (predicted ligase)
LIKKFSDLCELGVSVVNPLHRKPGITSFFRDIQPEFGDSLMNTKTLSALPKAEIHFIEPMYARLVDKLPQGQEWLYEVKFDGYRCLAGRDSTEVTLWSRRGNLFTTQFPHIAQACERLPPNTLLDGEIVALDESGRISFNLPQHHRSKAQALLFYVFDVLVYRGRSLLKEPLERRREVLGEAIRAAAGQGKAGPIAMSESLAASVADLVRVAREFGFEGVVAKRKDSVYESGKRTGAWVKYKVNRGQEFVIGGYTPGNPLDALIVGYYEGKRLLYAAKVRNGFVPQLRREVASRFKGLEIDACPFANLPERKRTQWALTKEEMKNCVWLKPQLVAQIEFTEWTPDGHLRHSKFVGLREDKAAREVVREVEG